MKRKMALSLTTISFLRPECSLFTETEGFKIDTMGTYHGLSLESVKVMFNSKNYFCQGVTLKGELRCKNELFSKKRAVREGSILTTCLVFLSFFPYIFCLKRSRKLSLYFRHLGLLLSRVVLTSTCL